MSNQNNTCRLCMSTNADINVLENEDILNNIISHCKVKVEKNDGLPECICYSCMYRVDEVSKFIEQCCQNDNTLRLQCIENTFIKKDEGESISIVKDDDEDESVNNDFPDDTSDYKNEEAFSYSPIKSESMHNDALMRSVQVAENGEEYVPYLGVKIKITRPTVLKKRKETAKKKHICPVCGLYRSLQHQKSHKESERDKFFCEICKAGFKNRYSLKHHNERRHIDSKHLECKDCQKTFKMKQDLQKHRKNSHNNAPKSHACPVCKLTFHIKNYLTIHMKTHTGERNYECSHCDKKCITRSGIESHMRVHTKERPFSCKICPKTFSSRNTLRDHVRWHTGEKPHECPICKKGFAQLGNMKSHFRHNHKNSEFVYYSLKKKLPSSIKIPET